MVCVVELGFVLRMGATSNILRGGIATPWGAEVISTDTESRSGSEVRICHMKGAGMAYSLSHFAEKLAAAYSGGVETQQSKLLEGPISLLIGDEDFPLGCAQSIRVPDELTIRAYSSVAWALGEFESNRR